MKLEKHNKNKSDYFNFKKEFKEEKHRKKGKIIKDIFKNKEIIEDENKSEENNFSDDFSDSENSRKKNEEKTNKKYQKEIKEKDSDLDSEQNFTDSDMDDSQEIISIDKDMSDDDIKDGKKNQLKNKKNCFNTDKVFIFNMS